MIEFLNWMLVASLALCICIIFKLLLMVYRMVQTHTEQVNKMLAILLLLDTLRTKAAALREAADRWDDPLGKPYRDQLARERWEPGGPSLPTIFLRAEADRLDGSPGEDCANHEHTYGGECIR